jgi:preprotein translocase subunit SecF
MLFTKILARTPKYDFIGKRIAAFAFTAVVIIGSVVSLLTNGLALGIDFAGGIVIEVRTQGPADLASMRPALDRLELGEVTLQQIGDRGDEVLIRVQRQPGGDEAQMAGLTKVRQTLGDKVDVRRVEVVGPKVGGELVQEGILAIILSIAAIAAYVWFRFEWQFGIGALVATFHDVIATFGFFSITGLEFNLTSVAAILTIVGWSVNDTVVQYDRVRENLRKYKQMSMIDLLNLSVNQTLGRTILTGSTTVIALLALALFGGPVLEGFSLSMIFGVVIGTYSSVYVAMPVLYYFNLRPSADKEPGTTDDEGAAAG